jgi:peptide chain release factor subunit 1
MKFYEEKMTLEKYFESIARDGNVTFGVKDTMIALENGAVETLILWDNLRMDRCSCKGLLSDDSPRIVYTDEGKNTNGNLSALADDECVTDRTSLLDWLVENRKKFGANIKFVSDGTAEGAQFVKGFGGIGSLLRYKMDFSAYEDDDDDV